MPEASVLSGQMPFAVTNRVQPGAADRPGEPHGENHGMSGQTPLDITQHSTTTARAVLARA